MKLLRSPRLIQLYDAFDDGKKEICLLLELQVSQIYHSNFNEFSAHSSIQIDELARVW